MRGILEPLMPAPQSALGRGRISVLRSRGWPGSAAPMHCGETFPNASADETRPAHPKPIRAGVDPDRLQLGRQLQHLTQILCAEIAARGRHARRRSLSPQELSMTLCPRSSAMVPVPGTEHIIRTPHRPSIRVQTCVG